MHTHLAHPPVSEPATSLLEMASDTLLNAFSKVRKPDERFLEIKEGLDRFEERLSAIERIEGRSRNRISGEPNDPNAQRILPSLVLYVLRISTTSVDATDILICVLTPYLPILPEI